MVFLAIACIVNHSYIEFILFWAEGVQTRSLIKIYFKNKNYPLKNNIHKMVKIYEISIEFNIK